MTTDSQRAEAGVKRVLIEKRLTNYELKVRAKNGRETVACRYEELAQQIKGFAFAAASETLRAFSWPV